MAPKTTAAAPEPAPGIEPAPTPPLPPEPPAPEPPEEEGPKVVAVTETSQQKYRMRPVQERHAVSNMAIENRVYKAKADGTFLVLSQDVPAFQRMNFEVIY